MNADEREAAWLEHQRRRWLQPDWQRWMQPDASRWMRRDPYARKPTNTPARAPDDDPEGRDPWFGNAKLLAFETTSEDANLRWLVADLRLHLLRRQQEGKYRADQPRLPPGRGGGQWAADLVVSTDVSSARKLPSIVREFGKLTARQYVSRYCQASVNRELPGEFENMTLSDIWNIAKGGDARARTCMKLLQPRFRK